MIIRCLARANTAVGVSPEPFLLQPLVSAMGAYFACLSMVPCASGRNMFWILCAHTFCLPVCSCLLASKQPLFVVIVRLTTSFHSSIGLSRVCLFVLQDGTAQTAPRPKQGEPHMTR
jgi:hypothetical protein